MLNSRLELRHTKYPDMAILTSTFALAFGEATWKSVLGQLLASGVLLLSGYQDVGVALPHGRSLRVFYGHRLRHLRFDYCDPGERFICCHDLRYSSLLRNSVDPALVAS